MLVKAHTRPVPSFQQLLPHPGTSKVKYTGSARLLLECFSVSLRAQWWIPVVQQGWAGLLALPLLGLGCLGAMNH